MPNLYKSIDKPYPHIVKSNRQFNSYSKKQIRPEKVSKELQNELKLIAFKYKALEKQFEQLQDKIKLSKSQYYLLSTRWFERWKLYAGYDEIEDDKKLIGCGEMPTLNEDLIDQNYQPSLLLEGKNQYLNVKLNDKMSLGVNFICISKEMFQTLEECEQYSTIKIIRKVVFNSQNKQRSIEYVLCPINIVFLFNTFCKDIHSGKVIKFYSLKFQVSHYITIQQFINQFRPYFEKYLKYYRGAIKFSNPFDIRLWLLPDQTTPEQYFSVVADGCKRNLTYQFRIFNEGSLLYNAGKKSKQLQYLGQKSENVEKLLLKEYQISDDNLFVCEVRQENQNYEDMVCFNKDYLFYGKCLYCMKAPIKLEYLCSCFYGVYCSLDCKRNDKEIHKNSCPNDAESDYQKNYLEENLFTSKYGKTGLKNLGNTCYFNSALQCLSHIVPFKNYFLDKDQKYKKHINKTSDKSTKGVLTKAFAKLIKHLWWDSEKFFVPTGLRRAVVRFAPVFEGTNQHDSGQILSYLLDGLHEDLNRAKEERTINSFSSDSEKAEEIWKSFIKKNNSIVSENFYGQYCSKIFCPNCNYCSKKYDEFLLCSLPLMPSLSEEEDGFEVYFIKNHIKEIRLNIKFEVGNSSVKTILKEVRMQLKMAESTKLIMFLNSSNTKSEYIPADKTCEYIKKYHKKKAIFVRQLLPGEDPNIDIKVYVSNISRSEGKQQVIIPRRTYFFNSKITYQEVHLKIISYFKPLHHLESNQYQNQLQNFDGNGLPFKIVCSPMNKQRSCEYCHTAMCNGCALKFSKQPFMSSVKLSQFVQAAEIQIRWKSSFSKIQELIDDTSICVLYENSVIDISRKQSGASIYECFQLFSEPEDLEDNNRWKCPSCSKSVVARKQMQIYKAPKVFAISLKRFKRKNGVTQKQSMFMRFPIKSLDLSEYVLNHELPELPKHNESGMSLESQKDLLKNNNERVNQKSKQKLLYDLIAVSNHMGTLSSGHYTAFCKQQSSDQWNLYDDEIVKSVKDKNQIVTKNAYMLFYQRRDSKT